MLSSSPESSQRTMLCKVVTSSAAAEEEVAGAKAAGADIVEISSQVLKDASVDQPSDVSADDQSRLTKTQSIPVIECLVHTANDQIGKE